MCIIFKFSIWGKCNSVSAALYITSTSLPTELLVLIFPIKDVIHTHLVINIMSFMFIQGFHIHVALQEYIYIVH